MKSSRANTPPVWISRRRVFALGGVAIVTAGAASARWFNVWAETGDDALSPPDAHDAALSGHVLLVDIRRPDEWALTGVGTSAMALDMRRPDFIEALTAALDGDVDRPVALICARGVRSRGLGRTLKAAGFTRIIDVPEGMLGSGAGPGWIKRGLPLRQEK
ncbi:MAG: rhodanese-like domain-containing protein [Sedimentitalea sp.]|uniref:rhodanese-like domain-containing protein n=1 Tax=Rhodobacterales TaxID=204455 RepID=UPI003299F054